MGTGPLWCPNRATEVAGRRLSSLESPESRLVSLSFAQFVTTGVTTDQSRRDDQSHVATPFPPRRKWDDPGGPSHFCPSP